jgi:hypothetical protein
MTLVKFIEKLKSTNQILEHSCAANVCAIACAYTLHQDNAMTDQSVELARVLLEIGIYPELWKTKGSITDPESAISFLQKIFHEITVQHNDFSSLRLDSNIAYFVVSNDHVSIVGADQEGFFTPNHPVKRTLSLTDFFGESISFIVCVSLSSVDLDKVKSLFDKYKTSIDTILEKKYYDGDGEVFPRADILSMVSPSLISDFEKRGLLFNPKALTTLDHIESLLILKPHYKNNIHDLFRKYAAFYLKAPVDIRTALKLIPECGDIIFSYACHDKGKYFDPKFLNYIDPELIVLCPKALYQSLWQYVNDHLKEYTSQDGYVDHLVRMFPDKRDCIRATINPYSASSSSMLFQPSVKSDYSLSKQNNLPLTSKMNFF